MALAERQVQAQWAVDPQHDPTECHDRRVTDLRCHPHGVTARQLRFQSVPFPSEGWVRAMQSRGSGKLVELFLGRRSRGYLLKSWVTATGSVAVIFRLDAEHA